jgi:anti-sigma28 factor (negative regulator of flagellin synthesis)
MEGVRGIGGVPEPNPERPSGARDPQRSESQSDQVKDGVRISSEAQEVSNVARLLQAAEGDEDVRIEKVEEARRHIAEKTYKLPEMVAEIARKLSKLLP